ncbi:Predicted exporter of the RND superfamily [hydrothermal vent metagenome]|uniref:Predicted exporter of the RND superfamily n=1 Tax=hydrothermal vent metagenome TaxID=652676 RepID=A0A1W1CLW1_9ZZZZ
MNIKKFTNFILKFRWYISIVIPLVTIAFAMQLKHAQFDGSYRIWFSPESKTLQQYDAFKAVFGNDDSIIIVFSDENGVMNKKALNVIDRLTEKLWRTKYIARVDSLTNYQYVHVDKDFIEDIDSFTQEQLKEKLQTALKEDLLLNRIISADAKTTMIVGRLTPSAGETFGASKKIKESVDQYIKEEKESGYNFYLAGGPVVNQTFSTLAKYDVTTFTPLVILVAMLLLWAIFRSFTGVVLTILVVIFTFTIVVSLQVIFGYKLNNFTANMPIFIVAIGIADAMHLYWIYLLARYKGLDNNEAILDTLQKNFLPILLTSLTTAVGFASLGISEIVPIATLGTATASAAILAFILTILFVPAVLAIINPKIKVKKPKELKQKSSDFASNYSLFIIKYDVKIILASLALFGLIGLGLTELKVDSNAVRYFKENVPFRQTVKVIQEKLTGPMAYEVVVDSNIRDGIKDPVFMHEVEKFCLAIKEKFPAARHTSSLIDVVKKFNEIVDFKKEIPDSNELIAQYLLLYSLSLPQGMEINDKMDIDERFLRVSVSMNVVDTSKDLEMIKWIEEWWKSTPYSAQVNGQTIMFAHMQSDVTDTLIESILLAITVISLLMLFIFKSIRMIPLFIIPNILPIILVVGAMGWLGISIDIGVAISGAIIMGIAVDDTIHFLLKYKEARLKGYNLHDSLTYVMRYAGSAIVFTTIVLSSAFLVFTFSDFMLNANFGLVTAIALVIAVVVDLLLLPAILSLYDGGEKSFLNTTNNQRI